MERLCCYQQFEKELQMDRIFSQAVLAKLFSRKTDNQSTVQPLKPSRKISLGWVLMFLLSVFLFFLASQYLTLDPDVYFQKEIYISHIGFLLMHIIGSMAAIIIGPFQFLSFMRTSNYLKLHRWLGRIYLLGVLFGGLGGLYMSRLAYGGIISQLGFLALAISWLFSGVMAYSNIRKKRIEIHRQWMTINYALTFAGVTLRLWLPTLGMIGFEFLTSYLIVAWLCWMPNLLVALWLNYRNSSIDTTPAITSL
jgi:hypothetical protein